jgi:hypothetical protein
MLEEIFLAPIPAPRTLRIVPMVKKSCYPYLSKPTAVHCQKSSPVPSLQVLMACTTLRQRQSKQYKRIHFLPHMKRTYSRLN